MDVKGFLIIYSVLLRVSELADFRDAQVAGQKIARRPKCAPGRPGCPQLRRINPV